MPITLPNFAQYQAPLFPLRGLWNTAPGEGDRFINAEIAWGTLGTGVHCVQFQLSGNSPVAFSQIVAMSIDNSRCGSLVDFIFPDSGFVLSVPAFNQGLYPVFTNALMFYANSTGATTGDISIVQILNSMPPPVAVQPGGEQQLNSAGGIPLATNATTPIVVAGVNGSLDAFTINYTATGTGSCLLTLLDGTGKVLWVGSIVAPGSNTIALNNLDLRFQNGINLQISGSTITGGTVSTNVYFSVP